MTTTAPRPASLAQPITAGIVASVTGFASTFSLVITGLQGLGATAGQAASGLLAVSVAVGILCIAFSLVTKLPLSFAWSTPGAAVLIAAAGLTSDFRTAVGAFVVCALLIVLTGLWPWLARAMTRIPRPISAAMLAGILFPICLSPVTTAVSSPLFALPIIVVWLVLMRLAPRWAMPAAVVVTVVVVSIAVGPDWAQGASTLPELDFVLPVFDPLVIVSLGIPLYVVTMAGQNVPGFAVLTTFGYANPPARAMLIGTGVASGVSALFGAHVLNLAALSAALMAGPDAHPDRGRRWIASLSGGVGYILLGLAAGIASALVTASPPGLITTVAGLAMLGAFVAAVVSAWEDPQHRLVAGITFLVVASGVVIGGIGSAFWGLVVGGIAMAWLGLRARRARVDAEEPVEEPTDEPTDEPVGEEPASER